MTDERNSVAEEVAELTRAVHDLRDREVAAELARLREEVAALRAEKESGCHGHACGCIYWRYTPATWTFGASPVMPTTIICGTTATTSYTPSTATFGAAGVGTTYSLT